MTDRALVDHPAFRYFLEEAALWRRAQTRATTVVDAAVQALLAGVESTSFVLIAGHGAAEAEGELGELLAAALAELNLTCLRYGDPETDVLAAAALCRSYLNGHLEAQQLTQQIHGVYGHDCHPLVEGLSILDDSFDTLDYTPNPTRAQLERSTYEAARALQTEADAIYRRSRGDAS
ncbi:MAG: hypothetical protein GY925_19405 [Actinomycetia bacterium]|nr:hypothetical protein [Actinomycetes bacterium]